MNIKTIAVIGAGQMGSGIAQVYAEAGYKVYLYDISEKQVEKGLESIQKRLERNAAKGRITAGDQEKTMGNLHASYALSDVAGAELIIEAASEKMEIKKRFLPSSMRKRRKPLFWRPTRLLFPLPRLQLKRQDPTGSSECIL